jgi:hypothetical protein
MQGSYTWARGYSYVAREDRDGDFSDLHFPYLRRRSANVPHAFKGIWVWDLPVGRGRRFGTDMNPWLDGVIGGWTFSGSGRVQLPLFRLANTVLVGMSHAEAQALFKETRFDTNPITGVTTVWNMPEDVIENTRRAYRTDPTSPNFYADGEAPTGRYFAPAGGPDCMALYAQDCAPDLFFHGPWFAQFDIKVVKRFPVGQGKSFQVDFELLNALGATNFEHELDPGSSANSFRITDQHSGPRIGQIAVRFNF